jgi:peptidoglycan hydrolase-like protein with peptidoglycan-binding domain
MKIKSLLVTVVLIVTILCFGFAVKAQTTDVSALIAQLQAQIQSLMQQIAVLQAQQGTTQAWCHTFNTNLGFVNSGSPEIGYLHTALQKQGISYGPDTGNIYNNGTSLAIIKFQKKYGILQTGYLGLLTRVKLNSLYGCTIPQPTPMPIPTPIPVPTPTPAPNPTQPITISSCQEITKPGNYVLGNDLTSVASSAVSACINIHD